MDNIDKLIKHFLPLKTLLEERKIKQISMKKSRIFHAEPQWSRGYFIFDVHITIRCFSEFQYFSSRRFKARSPKSY